MGGDYRESRGIYFGDREWREETGFTWFPADVFESRMWQSQDPNSPSFKLVQRITERVNAPPPKASVPSVAAVYVADQYIGGSSKPSGTQVIVKIYMRIPYLKVREGNTYVSTKDLFSQPLPSEDWDPTFPLPSFPKEVDCLRHLTDHKCPYTPSLITSFEIRKDNPWVENGRMGFIVMEKLPAITVSDIWADGPDSEEQIQEQERIQEAFKVAVLAVHNLGIDMNDRAPRNLMWDKEAGKCYLIDFEMASFKPGVMLSAKWEDFERNSKRLFSTFTSWDLIMDHQYRKQQELLHPRSEIY